MAQHHFWDTFHTTFPVQPCYTTTKSRLFFSYSSRGVGIDRDIGVGRLELKKRMTNIRGIDCMTQVDYFHFRWAFWHLVSIDEDETKTRNATEALADSPSFRNMVHRPNNWVLLGRWNAYHWALGIASES